MTSNAASRIRPILRCLVSTTWYCSRTKVLHVVFLSDYNIHEDATKVPLVAFLCEIQSPGRHETTQIEDYEACFDARVIESEGKKRERHASKRQRT